MLEVLIFEVLKYRFFITGVPKSVLSINSAELSSLTTKEPQYMTENTLNSIQIFENQGKLGSNVLFFTTVMLTARLKISSR